MREEEKTIRCGWGQAENQRDVGPKTFRRIRCGVPPGDQKRESRQRGTRRFVKMRLAARALTIPSTSPYDSTCFLVLIVMLSIADEGAARPKKWAPIRKT